MKHEFKNQGNAFEINEGEAHTATSIRITEAGGAVKYLELKPLELDFANKFVQVNYTKDIYDSKGQHLVFKQEHFNALEQESYEYFTGLDNLSAKRIEQMCINGILIKEYGEHMIVYRPDNSFVEPREPVIIEEEVTTEDPV
jgi:hypothetical protein